MTRNDLSIEITRNRISYNFKRNANLEDSFDNNIKNNCIDTFVFKQGGGVMFECKEVQTVANYPNAHLFDTLASDKDFFIKAFVPARESFADPKKPERIKIHGIVRAFDKEGQPIDENSQQNDNGVPKGRWLVHSTFYPKNGKDLNYAYSQGCIVFKTTSLLDTFNLVLLNMNVQPGDLIPAIIREVG